MGSQKKIKTIKNSLRKEESDLTKKYRVKIDHYRKTQTRLTPEPVTRILPLATVIPTVQPKNLEEFSTFSVFGAPEDLPEPNPPLGPYITDKQIKLSKGERTLLSKDPKYSLKYHPSEIKMATETVRMNSKA